MGDMMITNKDKQNISMLLNNVINNLLARYFWNFLQFSQESSYALENVISTMFILSKMAKNIFIPVFFIFMQYLMGFIWDRFDRERKWLEKKG